MLKNTWFSNLSHNIWSKPVDWKKYEKDSNHMDGYEEIKCVHFIHEIIFFFRKKKDYYMYTKVTRGYLKKKK